MQLTNGDKVNLLAAYHFSSAESLRWPLLLVVPLAAALGESGFRRRVLVSSAQLADRGGSGWSSR